jgi:hypothetical protein
VPLRRDVPFGYGGVEGWGGSRTFTRSADWGTDAGVAGGAPFDAVGAFGGPGAAGYDRGGTHQRKHGHIGGVIV